MDGAAGARVDAGRHSIVVRIALSVCNLTGVRVLWVWSAVVFCKRTWCLYLYGRCMVFCVFTVRVS